MREGVQVGAYRVLSQLGEGGMGSVWLAEHSALGRRAALKVLHQHFSNQPEIVQRFFNEARAATSIQDPGIVQIFDFGQHTDGSAYIVMELLDGEPLDRRLHRVGALAVPDALRIMRQVASTLGAAHSRGIIHRDLKPENIFMVRDPEVAGGERAKILDFGIAKLVGDTSMKTQTSAVMGTPTYMSPEQCRGAGLVDQRSDVYALGCVLFTLLVGRPPFDAAGIGEIIAMHLREPPTAPSAMRPGIPPEVDQLVLRCLQKDPAQRFASAGDLAIALGQLLGSSPRHELGHISGVGNTFSASKPTTLSAAAGTSSVVQPRKSRTPLVLGLVGVAAVAAGIGILAFRHGNEQPAAASTDDRAGSASAGSSSTTVAAAPADAAVTAPVTAPATDGKDPKALAQPRITGVLARFAAWSRTNQGAACPDVATLGASADDPWGHALQITCTDQPGNQMIGVVSNGPDGKASTADDIASWQLGDAITDIVRGPRWTAAVPPKPATADAHPTRPSHTPTKPRTQTAKPTEPKPDNHAPRVELDENGLPISR